MSYKDLKEMPNIARGVFMSWLLLLLLLLLHVHLTVLLVQLSRLLLVSPFVSPLVSPLVLLVRMQRCCTDARLPCIQRLLQQVSVAASGRSSRQQHLHQH